MNPQRTATQQWSPGNAGAASRTLASGVRQTSQAVPRAGATIPQRRQMLTLENELEWAGAACMTLDYRTHRERFRALHTPSALLEERRVGYRRSHVEFIAVGQEARGIIAIGQHATGVFAFGQVATGVIAIGQLARGCFALGQLGLGFIGWGQVGVGVMHAVGMVGAGGRGFGIVLRLVPALGKRRVPPETIPLEAAYSGAEGWVVVDLFQDALGLGLGANGQRLPIKLHRNVLEPASRLVAGGPQSVYASVRRLGAVWVCERIAFVPPRPYEKPGFYGAGALQFVGLFVVACIWWIGVGNELIDLFGDILSEPLALR